MRAIGVPIHTPSIWEYFLKEGDTIFLVQKEEEIVLGITMNPDVPEHSCVNFNKIVAMGYGTKLVKTGAGFTGFLVEE